MVLPSDFADAQTRAVHLARRTSLGVGGTPRWLFEPEDQAACVQIVRLCLAHGVPLLVLGGGCNLLVEDGRIEAAVIATKRMRTFEVHEDRVVVGAGNGFPDLVRRSLHLGIPGLPGCPGIPGSVGGVVFMNAGGRFGSVSDALIEVEGVDTQGQPFRQTIHPGDLGYRSSPFRGSIVTGAAFKRDPAWTPERSAALYHKAMDWKRESQPLAARSAGCMFKNPSEGISAGRLIDDAQLKGLRVGGAMVSTQHANFIVNIGDATAADVQSLIEQVRTRVRAVHGVDLELEVEVWPAPEARA
ncbi:MAG: UDP-N-acetylmuramate dehydrogenase [Planctomycetota bacterium]|nr:UDP-N-acetylmuramate dehydrogenase [Planctomycetota bacterium]